MQIMQRWADDDFVAYKIAQGIENGGGSVFSISYRGEKPAIGLALEGHAAYIVWGKVPDGIDIDDLDKEIDKELENTTGA